MWPFFLKDRVYSMLDQVIEIKDLSRMRKLHLRKHSGQGHVHGIEIEITGKTDRTLLLLMGDSESVMNRQILLKKGIVDFVYGGDWYSDDCYLLFPSESEGNTELTIRYRFLSLR